jgi:hypothetical protein
MARIPISLAALAMVALSACGTQSPTGPVAPRSADELNTFSAVEEAALRGATLAFLEAYASVQARGTEDLEALVGTEPLKSWVHWLGVQRAEFKGTGESTLTISGIAPSREAPTDDPDATVRIVELVGGLSFDLDPDDEDPLPTFERIVDGPMVLVQVDDGWWLVLDLTRDGYPLSTQFQPLEDPISVPAGDAVITLQAAFVLPTWQFGLTVEAGEDDVGIRAARLVSTGGVIERAGEITSSIARVDAGEVGEGLINFDRQTTADGVSLQLVMAPDGRTIDIDLGGLVMSVEEAVGQA